MTHQNLAIVLLLAAAGAAAQGEPTSTAEQAERLERQRISQTRAAEQAKFAAQEAACYQRFAVNDCLVEVRRARRELLADLRRQDLNLVRYQYVMKTRAMTPAVSRSTSLLASGSRASRCRPASSRAGWRAAA